ncbi:MAG TPA: alanine racemase [Armatimonadota bacterium]|nr:alanine racemase [Armatimonadota bacterium]
MRPAHLLVDLDAIRHNMAVIQQIVGPDTRQAAIVKANAYGHGAVPVCRACVQAGAAMLCVAIADEGVVLREGGITAPVLVLGPPDPEECDLYLDHDLLSTISDPAHVRMLADAAARRGQRARVHLKLDSGMGRHGARSDVLDETADLLAASPHVELVGIFSHLADACNTRLDWSERQLQVFTDMLGVLRRRLGEPLPPLHLANSAAIIRMPDTHFDYVRPGAILYGLNPGFDDSLMPVGFRPALSLKARLATIKRIPAGEPVGYRCAWRARRDTTLAVLPLGYADGYPRALSDNADVLVGDRRCPLVGMVSMDAITVDITDAPGAQVGDEAVLIGAQDGERITVEEIARRAGTIVEDIVGRLSTRLPRVYLGQRGGGES